MAGFPAVGSTFGRYRVTGVLGHGAMGVVLRAEHEELHRAVALKVLAPELALRPEFRNRFKREATTLAQLYSPHVIDVYDCGEVDGVLYIATQIVPGSDLREWLARHGPMPAELALEVMSQVAEAISDAHDAGIVHRDVKPSNVLLRASPGQPFAYVCDFGIAQSSDEDRTRSQGVVGTYAYMAPERHQGAEASVASDIYSLGCLLHTVLTGRPPFEGTDVQVAMQHISGNAPELDGTSPWVPALRTILSRCLAKDPAERYPTADALRGDLRAAHDIAMHGQPTVVAVGELAGGGRRGVEPARRSRRGRGGRWRGRRGAWLVAGVVVAGAAAALVAFTPDLTAREDACGAGSCAESAEADRCWDAIALARRGTCPPMRGLDAMRWIFPSFDRDFGLCRRRFDPVPDASVQTAFCRTPDMGPDEGVGYTEWASTELARRHFQQVYAKPPAHVVLGERSAGLVWRTTAPNAAGLFKVAILYRGAPFSATVWAHDADVGVGLVCAELTARDLETFAMTAVRCPDGSAPRPRVPQS